MDKWAAWNNEELSDYEYQLYEEEINGGNTWFERDEVLNEMNRRGMMK